MTAGVDVVLVKTWVVMCGVGSWSRCYGLFDSYDEAISWIRANQMESDSTSVHPVNAVTT